jgi:hypothetical protein
MGELDSATRQNGARSFVLPVRLNSSQVCPATILRNRDVDTGQVASQLFLSASLRLKSREAILEHLADLEDLYLAEKRLAKVRTGKSKTYSLNAVEQALGLAN